MQNLTSYLDDLKTDLLNKYKKQLDTKLKQDLQPLNDQINQLKQTLITKTKTLKTQKKVINQAYANQLKQQNQEKAELKLLESLWQQGLDEYFQQHLNDWYQSQLRYLSNQPGSLQYSPKHTPKKIITIIQKEFPLIKLKPQTDLPIGFIFDTSKFTLDLTLDSFASNVYQQLKPQLYAQIIEFTQK